MVLTVVHKCVIVLFILKCCRSSENPGQDRENITKLYELIAGAMKDDLNKVQISRRAVINDSVYRIHINKLKDVNGFKMHNIVINRTDTNSTIYINNPLESKLPHPFMTLEQFKDTIVEQRMKDRKAFLRSKKVEEDRKKWADIKATAKLKLKTFLKQIYTKALTSKKTESIGAHTKSVTEKLKNYKVENKSITVTTKVHAVTTKGIQNTKKHTTLTTKGKGTVKNLSSSTTNLKEKSMLSTAELSTVYARVKIVNFDQHSPLEHKLVTRKNVTNIKVSEQNITTGLEDKYKTPNDRESTTTTKEKIAGRSGRESTTVEKQGELGINQVSIVNYIDSTNSNANSALDGESTVTEKESTVKNEVESSTLGEESAVTEKKTITNGNEVESTTLNGDSTVIEKESTINNEDESTTRDRESITTETDSTESDEVETTTLDEGSTDIETELSSDEQLTTVDENEVTNDDEGETTHSVSSVSEDTEEFSAESSTTTTTTTTTTLPPTTRERWSRPRVFMGERSDGTSTSSSIS